MYGPLATLTVVLHFAFILFVVLGGFLAVRWPKAAWLHIPAVAWGGFVELTGRVCPLTPLENHFRQLAGTEPYVGDFLDRYLVALIYPAGLTREMQIALGLGTIALNVLAYGWVLRRRSAATEAG